MYRGFNHSFYNLLSKTKKWPRNLYVGNNISIVIMDLFETIEGKDISLNVISKSGTTKNSLSF